MRRSTICLLLGMAFISTAGRAASTRGIETSWGQVGVSYLAYRSDAAACENEAVSIDIARTLEVYQLIMASRALDNAYSTAWMANPPVWGGLMFFDPWNAAYQVERSFAVADNIDRVRAMLQAAMDSCLRQHGYRRFRLSAEQRARLKKLPLGSQRRHEYLYSLATDPAVLEAQAI